MDHNEFFSFCLGHMYKTVAITYTDGRKFKCYIGRHNNSITVTNLTDHVQIEEDLVERVEDYTTAYVYSRIDDIDRMISEVRDRLDALVDELEELERKVR